MARVLLIDDDVSTLQTFGTILRLVGHVVCAEGTGRGGIRASLAFQPDVALVDLCLPDMLPGRNGLDVISELLALHPGTRCMLVTGFSDLSSALEGIRLGIFDYLPKPLWDDVLVAAVARAVESRKEREPVNSVVIEPHDLARWSDAAIRFVSSPRDAKTLAAFGRVVGISAGAYRNWCRTADLSARRSLHFARAFRAVTLCQIDKSTRPQKFLDIVDLRTLSKFLLASGGTHDSLPPTVNEFLDQQKHVDAKAATAIRTALKSTVVPVLNGASIAN